jgi:hypothetical protein
VLSRAFRDSPRQSADLLDTEVHAVVDVIRPAKEWLIAKFKIEIAIAYRLGDSF